MVRVVPEIAVVPRLSGPLSSSFERVPWPGKNPGTSADAPGVSEPVEHEQTVMCSCGWRSPSRVLMGSKDDDQRPLPTKKPLQILNPQNP